MEEGRKITICPDVARELGFTEEGVSVDVSEDIVSWSDTEEDIYIEGISEWYYDFDRVADYVNGNLPESFDVAGWHAKGLMFAKLLREKLPSDVELWYRAPFEDKSNTIPDPIQIIEGQTPDIALKLWKEASAIIRTTDIDDTKL